MAYNPNIPNQANLVRTASGDLALMQANFEALAPVVSGMVVSGTLPSAAIQGFYFGDDTNRKRYLLQSDGSDVFQLQRNIGSEGSPSWQAVMSFTQVSGEDATFAVKVSGVTPTDDAHLATKAYVDGVGASGTLSGLTDTDVSSPSSGEVLEWDGSDWVNVSSAHALNDHTDVSLPSPASGEALVYNGAQWEAGALATSLSGLVDTAVSSPASGEMLEWDGSDWVNVAAPAGTLSGLTDTSISSPSSGQFLKWDGSDWVNQDLGLGGRYMLVGLSGDQSTDLISGDRVSLTGTPFLVSGITLTASGTLVLPSGGSFDLYAQYNANFAAANGTSTVTWYSLTGGSYIGSQGIAVPSTGTGNSSRVATTLALVVASGDDVEVELRFDGTPTSLTSIEADGTGAKVIEFGGAGGGGGDGSSTLSGLTDTSVSGATSGQVLTSDGAGTWTAEAGGGGGGGANVSGVIGSKLDATHSPVGLWLFEDDMTDETASGYDLTVSGGTERYGSVNGLKGFHFAEPTNLYHNVGSTALEITGDMTIEAILFHQGFSGIQNIVSYGGFPGVETEVTNILYEFGNINGLQLRSDWEYSGFYINELLTVDGSLPLCQLTHLAWVRDADFVKFYVDGKQVGATSPEQQTPTGGGDCRLQVGTETLSGVLCCLKIVASALSDGEVWSEYERTWAKTV